MEQSILQICYIETPLGYAKISGNEDGITSVSLVDTHEKLVDTIPEALLNCVTQLKEYFNETRKVFNLKLNPEGTKFQKKVWKQLETIPFGQSISYLELSKQLGDVKAIRAAASANGKNPLWIIVPCHRVIGSNGSLTGYAGGLYRKQWLLNHESVCKQQSLF
ncbi:methylated-DNA--[protein]-cysteine S-methyltransferase [Winogradskyella psychrotolerans]|uniref:methylated-DNA--[protein]-cysteine S-methyltransferase n=1 Tax=Winogradskyella psychrotolerans TaxID=1344585 RepID=UPI001C0756C4|nr:methylated-DNA--[protein]-cysteine S-methyltransferase [Winogradskyella psychrotolerans]MBU2926851.1 methylated-DNA--[protein]-cysteine S-methyltransferase [Winogradskyella psychrotolerans]